LSHNYVRGVQRYAAGIFVSVETFISTKAEAATAKKRPRDAFDVFVSVADQEPSAFKERWQKLMGDGLFRDANDNPWKATNGQGGALEADARH
jgi:hypothetical protein